MKKILVVDDEAAVRRLLRNRLERAGYTVTEAQSGEEALKGLSENKFDILISDFKMPGMHGLELIRTAKSDFPGLACVLVTGDLDSSIEEEAAELGALAFPKPLNFEDLLRALRSLPQ